MICHRVKSTDVMDLSHFPLPPEVLESGGLCGLITASLSGTAVRTGKGMKLYFSFVSKAELIEERGSNFTPFLLLKTSSFNLCNN